MSNEQMKEKIEEALVMLGNLMNDGFAASEWNYKRLKLHLETMRTTADGQQALPGGEGAKMKNIVKPGFYFVKWVEWSGKKSYVQCEAIVRANDGGGWHSISEQGHIQFYVAGKSPDIASGEWTPIEMTSAEWSALLSLAKQRQLAQGHVTCIYRRILGIERTKYGRLFVRRNLNPSESVAISGQIVEAEQSNKANEREEK